MPEAVKDTTVRNGWRADSCHGWRPDLEVVGTNYVISIVKYCTNAHGYRGFGGIDDWDCGLAGSGERPIQYLV